MRDHYLGLFVAVACVLAVAMFVAAPGYSAGTGRIFVSNEKGHSISVLDPETYEVIKTIETSRRPRDMRFNNEQTLLYVACGDDDVIDVIDVATLEVVDYIPTGPSPEDFLFNKDNSVIYVSNEEDSTLSYIDVKERLIIAEIPTGAEPEGVAMSKDGKTIYVASEVSDMVHVIDVEAEAVVENIIVGTRPRRFALTPDESELWVSAELSGEIYIIDRQSYEILDVIKFLPPGFREVDVTPVDLVISEDGSTAFVTLGRANHIAYVDVVTREIVDYVLVGSRAWGLALSRDETKMFVTSTIDG